MQTRAALAKSDRGEGAVSYIAVIILIAGILAAIAVSGIGTKIQTGIETAIGKVTSTQPGSANSAS
ncbi:hypothetical protein [Actinomadura sp. 7K507]|uniref:hypothetical protein n=1 Tax=Actinomadura sp. 7K507 TaxID=2530365 RepID=UPI0010E8A40B|nr:hypothetical protein [Actinomadura sp. 7K507]TDC80851.1 hypothetical protein E1285_33995 [Actinomadura sp. 7K507]